MSILTLTPAAEKQIDLLSEENECYGITLNIKGGGCAGFEYEWGTIACPTDLEEGDEVVALKRILEVPVGDKIIGRVVNPLGLAIDGKDNINTEILLKRF